jgi:anaerobic ribonucleoside-triphosphate reductase activating protein
VTVLGWGTRAGLWTQGCSIRCRGCASRDTWGFKPETEVSAESIVEWLESLPALDGLTISGGEPLDQHRALVELLFQVRAARPADFDILCYTGRSVKEAHARCPEVFDLVDALVVGPFDIDRPSEHPLMGSANQELLALTELGQRRYADASALSAGMQASLSGKELFMVGIPGRGDLEGARIAASHQGILFPRRSWTE